MLKLPGFAEGRWILFGPCQSAPFLGKIVFVCLSNDYDPMPSGCVCLDRQDSGRGTWGRGLRDERSALEGGSAILKQLKSQAHVVILCPREAGLTGGGEEHLEADPADRQCVGQALLA